MKNIKFYILAAAALLMTAAGCEKGPDGYTYDKKGIVLEAYGPNPLMRGNDLTFIGQNLDRVTSVVLPVDVEIPASDFKEASANSFKVEVPIEVEPGEVILKYGNGSIKAVTTLSYTEAFEIESVVPADKTLVPGDLVTVKGEYLNNVSSVSFYGNTGVEVLSEDFEEQSRHEFVFALPKGAVSGKLIISDVNGNQISSDDEIKVAQPAVASVSPANVRPGDKVTVSGTLLTSIDAVKFAGSSVTIDAESFDSVADDKIVVTVSDDAHDGALVLVSAAGEELVTKNSLEMVVPSGLKISAESRYKAGLNVMIEGDDLDLVTGVAFGDVTVETFGYEGGKITVAIPATAKDGGVTLSTAAEKSVVTEEIELVRPVLASADMTEVVAGNEFTVNGDDLDLVTELTLNGVKTEFDVIDPSALKVRTAPDSVTGKVAVKTANGTVVELDTEIVITYDSFVVVNSLPSSASVGEEVTMSGSGFNMIEAIHFGEVKVTGYSKRADDEMIFTIPAAVETGVYNIRFVLTSGEEEICPVSIEVKGAVSVIGVFEGAQAIPDWSSNLNLAWSNYFDGIVYGATLHIEFEPAAENPQLKIMDGNWNVLSSVTDAHPEWGTVDVPGITHVSYLLSDADVDALYATGSVIGGQNITAVTKVYLTYENKGTAPLRPGDVMLMNFEGAHGHTAWAGNTELVSEGGNTYLRVTGEVGAGGGWILNCNDFPDARTVNNIENYNLCLDVLVPSGWSDSGPVYQVVLSGWNWYGEGMLSSLEANGKWQTLEIPMTYFNKSGELLIDADSEIGLYLDGSSTSGLPAGMCFDNLRLSVK